MKKLTSLKYGFIAVWITVAPNFSYATGSTGTHFKSYKDWTKKCVAKHGPHGTGTAKVFHLNEEKNILKSPKTNDPAITLDELLKDSKKDESRFIEGTGSEITGYVRDVVVGGIESCNCQANDAPYRDTHIFLVADTSITSKAQSVIVEITPQIRKAMSNNSIDWSTTTIHTLMHKKIKVKGWLMYDKEHENASENIKHRKTNWRKTCWEIHPVTSFEVLKSDGTVDNSFDNINGDYVNP